MITDEELLKLYNPNAKHKNPGHLKALRAVYEAALDKGREEGFENGLDAAALANAASDLPDFREF